MSEPPLVPDCRTPDEVSAFLLLGVRDPSIVALADLERRALLRDRLAGQRTVMVLDGGQLSDPEEVSWSLAVMADVQVEVADAGLRLLYREESATGRKAALRRLYTATTRNVGDIPALGEFE